MDEVFGNSSTETVVSVHELGGQTCGEKLDDCNNNVSHLSGNKDISEGTLPMKPTFSTTSLASEMVTKIISTGHVIESDFCSVAPDDDSSIGTNSIQDLTQTARVSVIKSVVGPNKENHLFKVPFPPSTVNTASLRHTQSVVVSRHAVCDGSRPRANSATASIQGAIPKHYHPYQNLPIISLSYPKTFSPCKNVNNNLHDFQCIVTNSLTTTSMINSAPSTPRGSHNQVCPRVNSSYIQLWTGVKQEKDIRTASGSEEALNEMPSAGGYVRMSSPYVRSPNSSILSDLAVQLSSFAGATQKDIFCPFCPRPFTHETNLRHHIQAIHRHELQNVACSEEEIFVQHCPLCHGRFFNLDLLPSHLLEFHRGSVVVLLNKHKCLHIEENGIKCPFCNKKVPQSKIGEDVLLHHLLQVHYMEYKDLIHSISKPVVTHSKKDVLSRLSTEDLGQALNFNPGMTSTPGLSIKFKGLSCETDALNNASCGEINETWSSHCARSCEDKENCIVKEPLQQQVSKGILRSQTELSRKPSVKRELRFSVPPVTSAEFFFPESPESTEELHIINNNNEKKCNGYIEERQNIPVRVDSLSSADFIEMAQQPNRKRRRLSIGLRSKKSFKKKNKQSHHQLVDNVFDGLKSVGCGNTSSGQRIVTTTATRTFRKPKPVPPPKVPPGFPTATAVTGDDPPSSQHHLCPSTHSVSTSSNGGANAATTEREISEVSPFATMKLYSPLRMFRCNSCRLKFCDNDSLGIHISGRHRGLFGFLRPQFGCGICSAKFYENKYLVKHCLQHHTSLLEIRSPKKHKITIYRFSQD